MKVETLCSLSLLGALMLPGCILVTDGSELGSEETEETEGWGDESSGDWSSTGSDWETDDGSSSGTGGDDGPACGDNLLSDPSFEAGAPSEAWTESSMLFETPLCDESCSEDEGAIPYDGQWWVWFGGSADAESAAVGQAFTADGPSASLTLHLAINAASGTGEDVFTVSIDDTEVFRVTDADASEYPDYVPVEIDVSAFADGQTHTLKLSAELTGDGMTSFFVDDVGVFACDEPEEMGTSGGVETGSSSTGDYATSSSTGDYATSSSTGG